MHMTKSTMINTGIICIAKDIGFTTPKRRWRQYLIRFMYTMWVVPEIRESWCESWRQCSKGMWAAPHFSGRLLFYVFFFYPFQGQAPLKPHYQDEPVFPLLLPPNLGWGRTVGQWNTVIITPFLLNLQTVRFQTSALW